MTTPEPRIWIDEACMHCNGAGCSVCQGSGFETRRITLTALAQLLTELQVSLLEAMVEKGNSDGRE